MTTTSLLPSSPDAVGTHVLRVRAQTLPLHQRESGPAVSVEDGHSLQTHRAPANRADASTTPEDAISTWSAMVSEAGNSLPAVNQSAARRVDSISARHLGDAFTATRYCNRPGIPIVRTPQGVAGTRVLRRGAVVGPSPIAAVGVVLRRSASRPPFRPPLGGAWHLDSPVECWLRTRHPRSAAGAVHRPSDSIKPPGGNPNV